jgi:hypothetical protein
LAPWQGAAGLDLDIARIRGGKCVDFQSLRYAITLAEELHFGRAAQRHYIGAQPFGRRIHELERELGVRLFERTSRRVTVTPAGARIVAEARAIVDAADALTGSRHWAGPDEPEIPAGSRKESKGRSREKVRGGGSARSAAT